MKLPLSWLKEYIPCDLSAESIAATLTLAGIEVEKIEKRALPFSGVVVAKVLSVASHPSADRLRIATVYDGEQHWQIVCGAPNCRTGMKTALARIGALLIDKDGKSWKIKKSKLRDVESQGMLCSEDELGLSAEAQGIIELPEESKEGRDLRELYEGTLLDISLTPNLGHCMSLLGVARELSALLGLKLHKPSVILSENPERSIADLITVSVENQRECGRYGCRLVENLTVGPSPAWLKEKLEASGLRSINNVVDIGNFVMMEYGQPLHLFDYDRLADKKLFISSKTPYSSLLTLDDELREIPSHALLICDAVKPLAFAGIIGGKSSAISEKTKNVLIEAAYFSPESIRKTSREIRVKTESSQRFERGIDIETLPEALDRAAALLQEVAGGSIARGKIDLISTPFSRREIICRLSRVNQVLGLMLGLSELVTLLQKLDLEIEEGEGEVVVARIPGYRNDLREEIDLIEEVARLYGYNHITSLESPKHTSSLIPHAPIFLFEREIRTRLIAEGLQECLTCDLISPKLAEITAEKEIKSNSLIHVLHPSSIDQSILRLSLLPGLLNVIKYNQDHQNNDVSAFEVGRIHFKEDEHYTEQSAAAIILTGKRAPHHWEIKPLEVDLFDLKGMLENLLESLGIENFSFEISHLNNFHPYRQARIKLDDLYIGAMGEIHPSHLKALDLSKRVYFAEINLHDLFPFKKSESHFSPPSPYPGSERDWTVTLKNDLPIARVFHAIQTTPSRFLEKFLLLDLYKSDEIGKDKKNVTFRFTYRDPQGTIGLETVEREHESLLQEVINKLEAVRENC
jgi:phenylalanyl-tRNA synthetase beta chain